jgi:catechol 2,3-dioxygenase-like lactoylglutathione lyase family enzyme
VDLDHLNLRVRDAEACRDFYLAHFGFQPAFEAEGGYFLRNRHGFLLALVPTADHQHLPAGFHIGFSLDSADDVLAVHRSLSGAGVETSDVDDSRPHEDYVTFRCWDPDGTEIELFWEA